MNVVLPRNSLSSQADGVIKARVIHICDVLDVCEEQPVFITLPFSLLSSELNYGIVL